MLFLNVCRECPINNIQKAIQLAKENDTIVVQKGVYPEHDILINKSITLLGKDRPIINGQFKGNILLVQAPNVTIKGFKLSNVAYSATSENASIRIEKCKNFHIEDNILEQIYFGIIIYKGKNGIIKNEAIRRSIIKDLTQEMLFIFGAVRILKYLKMNPLTVVTEFIFNSLLRQLLKIIIVITICVMACILCFLMIMNIIKIPSKTTVQVQL